MVETKPDFKNITATDFYFSTSGGENRIEREKDFLRQL